MLLLQHDFIIYDPIDFQITNSVCFYLQITKLKYEGSTLVDEDLYSLACGPDPRMRSYTAYIINGVRYHTMARGEHRKT